MQEILKLIQTRHSARMPFDPDRPIAKSDLQEILEAGRWAPTAHNMQNYEIVVVDDKKVLQEIADIDSVVSEVFIKENYQQLSFSEEELKRKKVGLLGTMFPVSWRTPGMKPEIEQSRTRSFSPCPTLLVVLYDPKRRAPASEGDFLGIISLGCMMENLWLMATALGIDFHIVSSLAGGSVGDQVKRILAVPENLNIAFSVRLGYLTAPLPPHLRVRRDIEDFCHHNRFGNKGII
jgi:nitroreductase